MRGGLSCLVVLAAVSGAPAAETMRTEAARLRFSVPATWRRVPAAGDAEAARFRLAAAGGDIGETDLVLLARVGRTGGGADDQLSRWYARLTQPDGRPSKSAAVVVRRNVDGLGVTRVDLGGTYVGSAGSGGPAVQGGVSGYRLLGAFVEADDGQWIFEVLGPKATVGEARADFDALLFSLELHR